MTYLYFKTMCHTVQKLALTLVVAGGLAVPVSGLAPAYARGPDSFADLAESVTDAVVNISASQTIAEKKPGSGGPVSPEIDEMFKQFNGQRDKTMPPQRKSTSLGSGFIVDAEGIVITNNHVIADANDITVILTNGTKLKAELVGTDPKVDVAVLRVKPEKPLKAVKFGDSEKCGWGIGWLPWAIPLVLVVR